MGRVGKILNGFSMMLFQASTNSPGFLRGFGPYGLLRGGSAAGCVCTGIRNPVKPALGSATAGHEIHRSVGTEGEVGYVQGTTSEKNLRAADIAGSALQKMDRENTAECPIKHIESVLISGGELTFVSKFHRGGRPFPDMGGWRSVVWVIGVVWWPAAGHRPPSEIGTARQVFDPGRPVPRRAHVVLGIGIVGKGFPVPVEGDAIGVAQPTAEYLDILSVLVHAKNVSLVRSVRQTLEAQGGSPVGKVFGDMNGITMNGIDHSIGTECQIVAPVPHPTLGLVKHFLLFKLIVCV